jgi:hypothetical protein
LCDFQAKAKSSAGRHAKVVHGLEHAPVAAPEVAVGPPEDYAVNNGDGSWSCSLCSYTTANKSNVERHIGRMHKPGATATSVRMSLHQLRRSMSAAAPRAA